MNTDHKTCQSKHRLKIKNFTLFNIGFDRLQKKNGSFDMPFACSIIFF